MGALRSNFVERYGPWALVTGASSGIGAEFARQLASAGLNVILVARRKSRLDELSAEITKSYNVETKVIVADIAAADAVDKIMSTVKEVDLGLLVNNAGVDLTGSVFKESAEAHENLIKVNVNGPVVLTRAISPILMKRRRGGIFFVSSCVSRPIPYFATYSSSKAFITNFATIVGQELKAHGVDVTCIEPGVVVTERSSRVMESVDITKLGFPTMTAKDMVEETLPVLGKKDVFIPGRINRIMISMMDLMPRKLIFAVMGPQMEKLLKPEKLSLA